MGHIRLGRLPKTKKWEQVISNLSDERVGVDVVVNKVIDASNIGVSKLKGDKGVIFSYWILSFLLWKSKTDDFIDEIVKLGIQLPQDNSALGLLSNIAEYHNSKLSSITSRSLYSELAQQALRETLTYIINSSPKNLFQTSQEDIVLLFRNFSSNKNFARISRIFFTALLKRYLHFFLSKETSNYIFPNSRFESVYDLIGFNADLNNYCYQTAKIIEDFAGGWFSKKTWEGDITMSDVEGFIYVAIDKIHNEIILE